MSRVLILDGHPDPDPGRFCDALADAYASGARSAGHNVRRVRLCDLTFPGLDRRDDWEAGPVPDAISDLQGDMAWAQHLVIIYPLWLGSMPGRLKALFEQTFRPGFAFGQRERTIGAGRLKGRTGRIIVTMGMPELVYRLFYLSHSLKALKRNILGFVGIGPTRSSIIGNIEGLGATALQAWLDMMSALGRRAL